MGLKKSFYYTFIFSILVVSFLMTSACKNGDVEISSSKDSSNSVKSNSLELNASKEAPADKIKIECYEQNYKGKVVYPQLKGLPDKKIEEGVNQKIKDFFMNHTEVYEGKKIKTPMADEEGYSIKYQVILLNNKIVSIVKDFEVVKKQQAYPWYERRAININLETEEELELKDILKKDKDYSEQLLEIIKRSSSDIRVKDKSIEDIIDIASVYPKNNKLAVLFDEIHALGEYLEVEIPFEELKNIIDTKSYFWNAIQNS